MNLTSNDIDCLSVVLRENMQLTRVRVNFKVRIISIVEYFKNFCAWYKYIVND